jgi:hypothetical protein
MLPPTLKFNSLLQLQEALDKEYQPDLLQQLKENPKEALRQVTEQPNEESYNKYPVQTVQQLKDALEKDPHLADLLRYDPAFFLQKMVKDTTPPQYRIYRLLVGSLCTVLILIIAGALAGWFIKNSKTPPDSLIAMASAIIGILVGMFIHVPGKEAAAKN